VIHESFIVSQLKKEAILEMPFLEKHQCHIDFEKSAVVMAEKELVCVCVEILKSRSLTFWSPEIPKSRGSAFWPPNFRATKDSFVWVFLCHVCIKADEFPV